MYLYHGASVELSQVQSNKSSRAQSFRVYLQIQHVLFFVSQLKRVKEYGQNLRLGFKMGFEKLVMWVKRQKET